MGINVDGTSIVAIIEALSVPVAAGLLALFILRRWPTGAALSPDAQMIDQMREVATALKDLTAAVTALQGSQDDLAKGVQGLAVQFAELKGRLQR